MDSRYKRLVAILLVCVLTVGALPVYARDFELPEDSLEEPAENPVYASFSSAVNVDHTFSEVEGWIAANPLGAYTFGVQWDENNVYFGINHPVTDKELSNPGLNVTLNGKSVISETLSVTKTPIMGSILGYEYVKGYEYSLNAEVAVALADINVTVADYGTQIPVKITLGSDSVEGTIVLTSTVWEHTNNVFSGEITTTRGDATTNKQGYEILTNGATLYDRYDASGANPRAIRISATAGGLNAFNYCEFDMQIDSLPVYKLGESSALDYTYAVYGINWRMYRNDRQGVSMGIVNTEDGLVFVLRTNGPDETVRLNRVLGTDGVTLHLGCRWEDDDSLTLFLDGEKLANFKNAKLTLKETENKLSFISLRSDVPATKREDDIEVTFTNVAVGNSYGESILDSLTFQDIKGINGSEYTISQQLNLPTVLSGNPLTTGKEIAWQSSDASIEIIQDAEGNTIGKVTRPAVSKKVTLTATCGTAKKSFTLMVLGTDPAGNFMFVENDRNPGTGVGVSAAEGFEFTLDRYNSSIIYNQDTPNQKVNVIVLTDSDGSNRLNESVLTIWYSNDNQNYTQLEDYFKILRKGNKTYLYDFEIEAQYIKVHCTHYDIYEADFTNTLKDMIAVDYKETAFRNTSNVILDNDTDKAVYDQPWEITLEDAGVVTDKTEDESYSDVRFYLDGELLYHYFDGERFVVRVPRIPAHGAVKLMVLSGNVNAADIANKEYVHEVVYGTREGITVYNNKDGKQENLPRYLLSLPNGIMWGFRGISNARIDGVYYNVSTDGGLTWSSNYGNVTKVISESDKYLNNVQGAVYDEVSGRIIIMGRYTGPYTDETGNTVEVESVFRIMYSDDMGKTWNKCGDGASHDATYKNGDAIEYAYTYSKPVKVSTYDGEEGNRIDFVIPVSIGNEMVSAVYSRDCGKSWILSNYQIYATGNGTALHENGLTEANILEDNDGRLVMLSRCQFGSVDNFAVAYSYDSGITWTNEADKEKAPATDTSDDFVEVEAKLSTVYTSNTQPLLYEYGDKPFLFWGGNNVLGGLSYMRYPFNVAVSHDNMNTFENIQDMFSRYSMQGMTMSDRTYVTNPSVDSSVDDRIAMLWDYDNGEIGLVIDNFTDYFYRTKGAYDSFENSTVKYEGWSSVYGTAEIATGIAKEGNHSMMIPGGVSVVRSIPYLQNGKIAFYLYLDPDNVDKAYAEIELESAYGVEYGKAAPIAFTIENGKLNANGSRTEETVSLESGWNHFEIDLNLTLPQESTDKPAILKVNGRDEVELPVNREVGNYVCYVDITTGRGVDYYYVDSFQVTDKDTVKVPGETTGPSFYGNSIALRDNFAVKYYVEKKHLTDAGYTNPYVTVEFNGTETRLDPDEVGNYYVFTFYNLAPDQMTEHIYATLHATAADSSAYTSDTSLYSVAHYCYNQLASEETPDELRTLLVDLLNYGTAAQLYRDKTDDLANGKLTEEQKAWGSDTYDELSSVDISQDDTDNAVKMNSASLVLGDSVVIRVYFTASDITNLTIKAEGAGKVWTIDASSYKQDGARYYADFDHLNPTQMREVISFTAYNGDTAVSRTIQYSIESYACRMLNYSDKLKMLLESMIKYGDATKRWNDKYGK